jgi:LYC1 GNAT-like C-terminal domain
MMRLLNHLMAPSESLPAFPKEWGAPPPRIPGIGGDAHLSILYSYVGDFYKACGPAPDISGWHIHGAVSTIWKLKPEDPIRINVPDESFYLLSEERCYSLWESDAAYIREHMSKPTESPCTRFTFLPNNGLAAFLIHRTLAETPLLPKHPLGYWGVAVKTQDQESLPSAYATWTLDVALNVPPSLIVTRLRATRESLPALVKGMLGWAQQVGANAVEIWNLDTTLVDVAASLGGSTSRREDNFPAMVWYGPEQSNEIEWIFNEKYIFLFELSCQMTIIFHQVCMVLNHLLNCSTSPVNMDHSLTHILVY